MTNKEMLEEKIAIRIGIFLGELIDAFKFLAAVILLIALSLGFVAIWLVDAGELMGVIR